MHIVATDHSPPNPPSLSARARAVLGLLYRLGRRTGYIYARPDWLACAAKCSVRQFRASTTELEEHGFVTCRRYGRRFRFGLLNSRRNEHDEQARR